MPNSINKAAKDESALIFVVYASVVHTTGSKLSCRNGNAC